MHCGLHGYGLHRQRGTRGDNLCQRRRLCRGIVNLNLNSQLRGGRLDEHSHTRVIAGAVSVARLSAQQHQLLLIQPINVAAAVGEAEQTQGGRGARASDSCADVRPSATDQRQRAGPGLGMRRSAPPRACARRPALRPPSRVAGRARDSPLPRRRGLPQHRVAAARDEDAPLLFAILHPHRRIGRSLGHGHHESRRGLGQQVLLAEVRGVAHCRCRRHHRRPRRYNVPRHHAHASHGRTRAAKRAALSDQSHQEPQPSTCSSKGARDRDGVNEPKSHLLPA
mmetsp:Transcript_954/g.3078  ORF Transcript_954/g.3078 Transcript_954/m.3078 type:complete len:281 (+) Transcript_954:148-990(+)